MSPAPSEERLRRAYGARKSGAGGVGCLAGDRELAMEYLITVGPLVVVVFSIILVIVLVIVQIRREKEK